MIDDYAHTIQSIHPYIYDNMFYYFPFSLILRPSILDIHHKAMLAFIFKYIFLSALHCPSPTQRLCIVFLLCDSGRHGLYRLLYNFVRGLFFFRTSFAPPTPLSLPILWRTRCVSNSCDLIIFFSSTYVVYIYTYAGHFCQPLFSFSTSTSISVFYPDYRVLPYT